MSYKTLLLVSILCLSTALAVGQTNCSAYNSTSATIPPFNWNSVGTQEHDTGAHTALLHAGWLLHV